MRSGRTSSITAAAAAGSLRSASTTRAPEAACQETLPWGSTTPWTSTPGCSASQEVDEVAAHEAPGAGDEQPHRYPASPWRPPSAPTPRKFPIEPMLASSRLKRHCVSSRPFQL